MVSLSRTLFFSLSVSLSLCLSLPLPLSLSHSHTHTHTLPPSLYHLDALKDDVEVGEVSEDPAEASDAAVVHQPQNLHLRGPRRGQ